jgi:hypothetical protein
MLFVAFIVALVVATIFFEIGLRAYRNENERKSKDSNSLGFRWLIYAGVLLVLSVILSLLKF